MQPYLAADHAPQPSTSTHLVVNQSTFPKPTRIPLGLASHNKPGLQEPWFSVMTYFCYFVQHILTLVPHIAGEKQYQKYCNTKIILLLFHYNLSIEL